jgi:hypothetical protein
MWQRQQQQQQQQQQKQLSFELRTLRTLRLASASCDASATGTSCTMCSAPLTWKELTVEAMQFCAQLLLCTAVCTSI